MTEHFSFFDAIQDSNGHYDREYNAQQFTDYFKSLVTTGVMKGAYNQLEVTANGSNMTSSVKSGIAFVEGRYYYNDALLQLTHDTEVVGLSRIDRIVVRMDLSTDARYVKTFIKKGVPAASPVPPTLIQTQQLYEISLAQVRVVGGQTYIAANAVTDERGKDIICPWAGSKILPNFDNDTLQEMISNQYHLTNRANAKDYTGDLNNLLDTGFYATPYRDGANMPIGAGSSRRFIQVVNTSNESNQNVIYQILYEYDNDGPNIYTRNRNMFGTWGNWYKEIKTINGTGSPEGVVSAPVGTLYINQNGGATTTFYFKTSGSGNTGWTAK